MAKVTIEDISQQTGLSRGTVSRALNDRPDISAQTKQRVLEACRKLNYIPSTAARSLATGKNYAIAVLLSDLHDTFMIDVLRGALQRAEQERFAIQLVELPSAPDEIELRLRRLVAERIDGVLVATAVVPPVAAQQMSEALGEHRLSSIAPLDGVNCDQYRRDDREMGRLAGRYAASLGSRTLYLHAEGDPAATERLAGFQEAVDSVGAGDSTTIARVAASGTAALASVEAAIDTSPRDIRLIVGSDDALALAAVSAGQRGGRRLGLDFGVLGQGNSMLARAAMQGLSSIDSGGEEIGRRAMDTLLARLGEGRHDSPQTTFIAPQIVHRETTRPSRV